MCPRSRRWSWQKRPWPYRLSDFVFDGSMEGDFERSYPAFAEFSKGMMQAGIIARAPALHLTLELGDARRRGSSSS